MVEQEILPGLNLTSDQVWESLATLLNEFQVRNQNLLNKREQLQTSLNQWHLDHPTSEPAAYKAMLQDIGYLLPEPEQVSVTTSNVDIEISTVAGPQLVVPINNARYALNAANARWGSLYDALYGTNIVSEAGGCEKGNKYTAPRGAAVVAKASEILDEIFGLNGAKHSEVVEYSVQDGALQCKL